MEQFSSPSVTLIVPKQHVKTVKQALERVGQLDRSRKITPESRNKEGEAAPGSPIISKDNGDCGQFDQSLAATPGETFVATQEPSSSTQQTKLPELPIDTTGSTCMPSNYLPDGIRLEDQSRASPSSSPPAKISRDGDDHKPYPLQYHVTKWGYIESAYTNSGGQFSARGKQQRMCIPTTIPYPLQMDGLARTPDVNKVSGLKLRILQNLALSELSRSISISPDALVETLALRRAHRNPVHKALEKALISVLDLSPSSHSLTVEGLVSAFPEGYSVYSPMLLLPHNAFSSSAWKSLIARHPVHSDAMASIWQCMAEAVGATHAAVNSPIPLSTTTTSVPSAHSTDKENILRSPLNLTTLYGDFGTTPTPQTISTPTANDFAHALWVTARQNGIWQVWAPLYTMFSRGNIREKTRVLNLPTVTTGLDAASAAVDLFAGIGYFAFSYRKSSEGLAKGIKQVLCWELNPWSVEGLRRGAEMNGWTCRVLQQEDILRLRRMGQVDDLKLEEADFIVLQTTNEAADLDYPLLRLPKYPVRHVNLGLLPSSKLSWRIAVAMLDTKQRGWIHVHENVNVKDVESMQHDVERKFKELVSTLDSVRGEKVCVAHVERVKMYAPGVVHCVFDVCVG